MAGTSPRVIALVGPQSSGKTSLLESILCQTGTLERRSDVTRLIGDASHEAKERGMGTEINVASGEFMGDTYTFLDCPGSVELAQEAYGALQIADAAVVVTEADAEKIVGLSPLFKFLDDHKIPHYIFVNKLDKAGGSVRELAESLTKVSQIPVILRHLPIRNNDEVTGYVDLASERAYVYKKHAASEIVDLPAEVESEVAEARYSMLETLADFDDTLMEELLEDIVPSNEEINKDLTTDFRQGLIAPVLIGSALNGNGVHRLLKALRHEAPTLDALKKRLGVKKDGEPLAQVFKTYYAPHLGKISIVRILRGSIKEGGTLNGERPSGLFRLTGDKTDKVTEASEGVVVGLGRLDEAKTGDTLVAGKGTVEPIISRSALPPVYTLALTAEDRSDEVKLVTSLGKLVEEDPSLIFEQSQDTHEILLRGQGEVQLQIGISRLKSKYGVNITTSQPHVPYKETIRRKKTQHSRYKKQSGGHGQFGDVVVEFEPLASGSGFIFKQSITGGAVPRQYIPSVEAGIREHLSRGPLGFPIVDLGVTLVDGSYHSVDSSDMAFKSAGRLAMAEALPDCKPALLEPIMRVDIHVPSAYTGQINGVISGRRGQVLGFDARENWTGWDTVQANMPQSEIHDLIIEIRSITLGAGTFEATYDHLSELSGRLADQVLQQYGRQAEKTT